MQFDATGFAEKGLRLGRNNFGVSRLRARGANSFGLGGLDHGRKESDPRMDSKSATSMAGVLPYASWTSCQTCRRNRRNIIGGKLLELVRSRKASRRGPSRHGCSN